MPDPTVKLAYSIHDVAKLTGLGRSLLFEEIRAGHLLVKKAGRRTLVLHADLGAWLTSLPEKRHSDSKQNHPKSKPPK
jgi:hypothetical protein